MTSVIYNEENMRYLLYNIIIPLLIILILFFIGTKVYELINRKKDKNRINYVVNYWNNVIGVLFTSILLSLSIGYSIAFIDNLKNLNAVNENIYLYYFFMVFPIFPLIFLIYYICKFIKNINKKEELEEIEKKTLEQIEEEEE